VRTSAAVLALLLQWPGGGPAVPAAAQEEGAAEAVPQSLDLPTAVRLAREHNPAILESEANADAARAGRREARLGRLPTVVARATALRTTSPADAFALQMMQERFSFPAFTQGDPNDPDPFDNFSSQIEIAMPVFTGGALSAGIRQAGRMFEAADAVRSHSIRAVDLGVTNAYLGAQLADEFLSLAQRARQTTARHLEQAQSFYEAGMIVESDFLRARVQLARMDENLVRAQNGARLARAALAMAMGVEQGSEFTLAQAPDAPEPCPASVDEAIELAHSQRQDLRAAERRAAAMEAGVSRARAEYLPTLGVAARFDWNDDRLFGGHGDSYTLMARAEWNVWNWTQTAARVSRSRSEHRGADEARRAYADQVELEVRQAWQGVEEARARRATTEGAVAAAERALAILEDRFSQGVAKLTDLLDAETIAHEERVRDVKARFDLQTALRTLSFAIGDDPVAEVNP
jgi:outer membrane protein TolC